MSVNPIGPEVEAHSAQWPERKIIEGKSVRLEPLEEKHGDALYEVVGGADRAALWDYMFEGPFTNIEDFRKYVSEKAQKEDPVFFAIINKASDRAIGIATLMRIDVTSRVLEVGNLMFSPVLQRSTASTEVQYLLARTVFEELGYRRYEWKCNNLNAPSQRSAVRLGFTFEGVFRQHMIVKGRNRDTAWFSMIDKEWPTIKQAFETFLAPDNFDASGHQRRGLATLRESSKFQA